MKQLIRSIALTLLVSAVVATPWLPDSYWKAMAVITGIQIFGAWIINSVLEYLRNTKEQEDYNRTLDILAQNSANIPCPKCSDVMTVSIFIAEENIVECVKCGCETKVDVTLTPIMLTKMIDNTVAIGEIFEQINAMPQTESSDSNKS
jgi:Zn ribbon nucleic-acid-binding protein